MVAAVTRSTARTLDAVAADDTAIRRGDNNPAVSRVQQLLNQRGQHVGVDGDFGPATESAVKRFQSHNGLRATGIVDHGTLKALEGPGVHHKDEYLAAGDTSANVKGLQDQLHQLGYGVAQTGHYDASTAQAVAAFKHDAQLKDQGGRAVDGKVQRMIGADIQGLNHAPEHTRIAPSRNHTRLDAATATAAAAPGGISAATTGSNRTRATLNVQAHLRAAGFDPKQKDGRFDVRTGTAVRAFQRHSGLPQTGVVDSNTWNKLKNSELEARSGTSPEQTLGERSSAVLASEKLLKKAGFNPGKVDGLFDADTQRASRAFERKHAGTGADGAIGPQQLRAMKTAAADAASHNTNTVQGCAEFLLHSKNVQFWSGLSTGSDRKNMQRLAAGHKAFVPSTGGFVTPNLHMMQSLVDMAKHGPIQINALTGGQHSPGSNHYRGLAVDLDLAVGNHTQIERIARKHGGQRNFETDHIHLDF